jgi:hypothetical protein
VGYGDYHAISDPERVLFSFILLFGTVIFSFITGNFIEILFSYKQVTADNEDSSSLTGWLGLMARFNKERPLPKELTRQIEAYFEYYWLNDKNYAIQSEEDKRFMKELPKIIRRNVSIITTLNSNRSIKNFCLMTSSLNSDNSLQSQSKIQTRKKATHGKMIGSNHS